MSPTSAVPTPTVRDNCRHYVMQTITRGGRGASPAGGGRRAVGRAESAAGAEGERLERCRLGANQSLPFACPDGCLFYERRTTSSAGWRLDRPRQP